MKKITLIDELKENLPIQIFTHEQILPFVAKRYSNPNAKIKRAIDDEELIRLKKGLYTYAFSETTPIPPAEKISAALLQPSYVSFEYALSHHGMIPERVYEITAATTKREKTFLTSIGRYSYKKIPYHVFHLGLTWHYHEKFGGNFFATPEKALCDKIRYDKGIGTLTQKKMLEYLIEDLRLDFHNVTLDYNLIEKIGLAYKSRNIQTLAILIKKGKI